MTRTLALLLVVALALLARVVDAQDPSGLSDGNRWGGMQSPVAQGSLSRLRDNWGDRRGGGARCHAGVDLFTRSPYRAVAAAAGTVTATGFFYTCSGGSTNFVMIYHPSLGITINYGEINTGAVRVRVGQSVVGGQDLGTASRCGMLHTEMYQGRATRNLHWRPSGGSVRSSANDCRRRFQSTRPATLLDPTNALKWVTVNNIQPVGRDNSRGTGATPTRTQTATPTPTPTPWWMPRSTPTPTPTTSSSGAAGWRAPGGGSGSCTMTDGASGSCLPSSQRCGGKTQQSRCPFFTHGSNVCCSVRTTSQVPYRSTTTSVPWSPSTSSSSGGGWLSKLFSGKLFSGWGGRRRRALLSENTDAAADAATATAAASDVKVGVGATRVGDAKAAAPEDQTDAAATADNDKKNKNDGDDVDDTIDLSSGVPGMVDQEKIVKAIIEQNEDLQPAEVEHDGWRVAQDPGSGLPYWYDDEGNTTDVAPKAFWNDHGACYKAVCPPDSDAACFQLCEEKIQHDALDHKKLYGSLIAVVTLIIGAMFGALGHRYSAGRRTVRGTREHLAIETNVMTELAASPRDSDHAAFSGGVKMLGNTLDDGSTMAPEPSKIRSFQKRVTEIGLKGRDVDSVAI